MRKDSSKNQNLCWRGVAEKFNTLLVGLLFLANLTVLLLVESLGAQFILVDLAVSVLVVVLPGVALTGTKEERGGGNDQAQAFHVGR